MLKKNVEKKMKLFYKYKLKYGCAKSAIIVCLYYLFIQKRSAFDFLPSCALVAAGSFATGSTRGFDELVPHQVSRNCLLYSQFKKVNNIILLLLLREFYFVFFYHMF